MVKMTVREPIYPKPHEVTWDELFMSMVFLVASKSKDVHTHVGAVIVDDMNIVRSVGYNGFPRGLDDEVQERLERPEKYSWMVHAELNAILNARTSVSRCRMYTNGIPCVDCAKAIIQSGIREIIVHKDWGDFNNNWNVDKTLCMFEEVGIHLRYYDGSILRIQGWKDGKVYTI